VNILFVLPRLSIGGAERTVVRIANGLADRGHDVLIYSFSAGGPLEAEISQRVRFQAFSDSPLSLSLQVRALRRLIELLRFRNPDAVLCTLFQTNLLVSLAHRLARTPAKLVLREANYVSSEWRASRAWPVARLIGPHLYRRAEAIVVPAQAQAADLCRTLRVEQNRIEVIGNPVVSEQMRQLSKEVSGFLVPSDLPRPVVLGLGRLVRQKGFDVLIRGFQQFRERNGGTLLILGEGEDREQLSRLATELGVGESVLMPGVDLNPFKYMRFADVFVLSSRYEGLPNALIQALALGVRCVATDCHSGPREVLDHGKLGALVPVDDHHEMSLAMDAVLSREPPVPGAEWFARYDESVVIGQYEKLLFNLTGRH
jgi:glycosyltransferase involved in cell wall biosynthesis